MNLSQRDKPQSRCAVQDERIVHSCLSPLGLSEATGCSGARSGDGTSEVRTIGDLIKIHYHPLPHSELSFLRSLDFGEHVKPFVELDDAENSRILPRTVGIERDVLIGEGINTSLPRGGSPLEFLAEAIRAKSSRVEDYLTAALAALEPQFAFVAALPIGLRIDIASGIRKALAATSDRIWPCCVFFNCGQHKNIPICQDGNSFRRGLDRR